MDTCPCCKNPKQTTQGGACKKGPQVSTMLWMDEILHHLRNSGMMISLFQPTMFQPWFQSGANGFRPPTVRKEASETTVNHNVCGYLRWKSHHSRVSERWCVAWTSYPFTVCPVTFNKPIPKKEDPKCPPYGKVRKGVTRQCWVTPNTATFLLVSLQSEKGTLEKRVTL